MEKDVAPGIIEKVNKDFESKIDSSAIHVLEEKAANGAATYEDAYKYAEKIGEARSKALQTHVTAEALPEGKIYYNIADRLMNDSLSTDHEMVAEYAAKAQQAINEKAGIKLKAQKAELEQDRIDSFTNGLCGSEGNLIEDVLWKLGEPVVTHARTVVDSTIKKNAEFQHKAGLKATITRKAAPRCCDWCTDLEGDYTYPNVPREVFQRHDHCKCTVDYEGKKLKAYESGGKAHSFQAPDEGRLETFTKRDTIEKLNKEKRRKELVDQQKQIEKIEKTPFYAFKSLSAAARKFFVEDEKTIKNTDYYIMPGTYVTGVKVISTGDKIREVDRLINTYKLPNGELTKVRDWYKVRGRADVTDGVRTFSREIHWYQAENIGKVEFKFPSNKKQR